MQQSYPLLVVRSYEGGGACGERRGAQGLVWMRIGRGGRTMSLPTERERVMGGSRRRRVGEPGGGEEGGDKRRRERESGRDSVVIVIIIILSFVFCAAGPVRGKL